MRNRDPHRQNVENILAICLSIMTLKHIGESPSARHATRKCAWNEPLTLEFLVIGIYPICLVSTMPFQSSSFRECKMWTLRQGLYQAKEVYRLSPKIPLFGTYHVTISYYQGA